MYLDFGLTMDSGLGSTKGHSSILVFTVYAHFIGTLIKSTFELMNIK